MRKKSGVHVCVYVRVHLCVCVCVCVYMCMCFFLFCRFAILVLFESTYRCVIGVTIWAGQFAVAEPICCIRIHSGCKRFQRRTSE